MKKILLLSLSLFGFSMKSQMTINYQWSFNAQNTTAQGGNVDNRGMVLDATGNIYVTGFFNNTADFDPSAGISFLQAIGNQDVYLAKYSPTGALIWANRIGGSGNDNAAGIAIDASSNIYITGTFNSTVDFDPGAGVQNRSANGANPDIFVAKYNSNGNYQFAAVTGGTLTDAGNAVCVSATNVYVTGSFYNVSDFDPSPAVQTLTATPGGSPDAFVWKLDLNGNYVNAINFGSGLSEVGNAIAVDASDNVFVTGSFMSTCDFDPSATTQALTSAGGNEAFIAKYNSSLAYVYAIGMGGTGNEVSNSIAIDASGNSYITGGFTSASADFDPGASSAILTNTVPSPTPQDMFYAKYNSTGGYVYAYSVGSAQTDVGRRIAVDASSNVIVTGQFGAVADFDPGAGTSTLNVNPVVVGNNDVFLAKYDATGAYSYAYSFGDAGQDASWGLGLDASNNIFVTGTFYQTVDFDFSVGTSTLAAGPSFGNTFIAKYNNSPSLQFVKGIGDVQGGGLSEYGQCILRDSNGDIYVSGYFSGAVDFDPSAATQVLTSAGGSDVFIAKYSAAGTFIWAKSMGGAGSEIIGNGQKGNGMKIDASNNVYITGGFNSTNADFDPSAATATLATNGNYDVFFAKYDLNGNYIYAYGFGGSGDDKGLEITVDAAANAYVGGYITGSVDFDPSASTTSLTSTGNTDGFFAEYNSTGGFVNAKLVGGTSGDQVQTIEVEPTTGDIIVGGYFQSTADFDPSAATQTITAANGLDAFFGRYTNAGAYIFAKSIGGSGQDMCSDLTLDIGGNIFIAGDFGNANADFDPSPAVVNLSNAGSSDAYFAQYDANGNYVFAKSIGGISGDGVNMITLDASKNIYITGPASGAFDFDPTASVLSYTSSGSTDCYIAKYDPSGNVLFGRLIGGTSPDVGYGILTDGAGAIYCTGTFNSSVDFDLSSSVSALMASNQQDLFVARYNECTLVASVMAQTNALCNSTATGSATMTVTGGSGFTYTWTPVGGNSNVASNLAAGNYTFAAENSCGAKTTETLTITQPASLTLVASPSSPSVCAANSLTISSNPTGGTAPFTYSLNGVGSSSAAVVSPTANASYTVDVVDVNNCTSSFTLSVVVYANPAVSAVSSSTAICSGSTATLTAGGANTYLWNTSSTNTVIVDSPTSTTVYTVTGTDANNCVSDATVSVVVNASPIVNAVSSNTGICSGNSATLTASGANTYLWSTSSTNTVIVDSPTSTTIYSVTGTDANNCTANATVTVVVNANPTVTAVSSTSILCTGQTATFTASGALTYTWSNSATGSTMSDAPTVNTTYSVTGTDANGCSNTSSFTQSVSTCSGINALTANANNFNVYPNPTSGKFTLNVTSYEANSRANIYNSVGELVRTVVVNDLKTDIDITEFKSGIYFIKLEGNGIESTHFKIIKD